MAFYIVLGNYTDQGIRAVKDTTKRAEILKELAKNMGATIRDFYWTIGPYQIMFTIDTPDDDTMSLFVRKVIGMGSLKVETLRGFSENDIGRFFLEFHRELVRGVTRLKSERLGEKKK